RPTAPKQHVGRISPARAACSRTSAPRAPSLPSQPSFALPPAGEPVVRGPGPRRSTGGGYPTDVLLGGGGPDVPKGGGYAKLGKPYEIRGVWYTPRENPHYDATGIASFYAGDFHNKKTANGEWFDMNALTAAHKTLPLPSYVIVENLNNGRRLKVRVNDRGPFVDGRIIDLSKRVAELLGMARAGLARVRVTFAGPAPVNGSDVEERAYLARQPWARRLLADARR
ncbi:MAG: septal ring lytic transglycosylase RlpA family protein, partial [Pseudomonadota bacterium]